jgi:hypothetical protein
MKRILLLLIIAAGLKAKSQVYNNEWIDYSKTYYKFTIKQDVFDRGLFRIPQTLLAANGLGSIPAEQFQLWRDGAQVPIYTSVATGVMGSSDYIEFYNEINDGRLDKPHYREPTLILNEKWSLQTDTAAYFLTVNPAGGNLRLTPTPNNVAGNILPVEPYFIHTAGLYYREKINPGFASNVGEYVYSSAYDTGECWTSADIGTGSLLTSTQTNMFTYTGAGAPTPRFKINATGNALNARKFRVTVNGDSIIGQVMDYFDLARVDIPLNPSLISLGVANVEVQNQCLIANDRMSVAQYEIVYPRLFNFDFSSNFIFNLPANPAGNYLEITNFNYNSYTPVLYDMTNGKRYDAVISGSGPSAIFKFALLGSAVARKLIMVAEYPSNAHMVTSLKQRNFVNFSQALNQGDYLIITHPILTLGAGGSNPVDDYRVYRSSPAGGGYNAKIYMIDELVDQFACGIKKHPASIRNFLRWARNNFAAPPKAVFLVGKGVTYNGYRILESEPRIEELCLVPTFGNPGSDVMLSTEGTNEIPLTPIGRLSAIYPSEVADYLVKVKEYEVAQKFQSPLIQDKAWMKNVMHVVGAGNAQLQPLLDNYMSLYTTIIRDTMFGGNVNSFSKSSTDPVQTVNNVRVANLFQEGISLLTYFGHSSAVTLEFNLDEPSVYNNQGKYPVFIALGCNAGNFFTYSLARFDQKITLSEKFVLAPQRGTIAFLASTHFGVVHYLDVMNTRTYNALSTTHYGKPLGEVQIETIKQVFNLTSQNDFYSRFHCEQATIHGDPMIKLNTHTKPDYVIEPQLVRISPSFVSVAEAYFTVDAKLMNMGKAINTNVVVEVKRTFPDQTTVFLRRDTIPGIRFLDSLKYNIPIVATRDKGLNKITITIDPDNTIPELYETNNVTVKDVFIYEDEARPAYPYNFSIVGRQNIKLIASTANPYSPSKQYTMEIDTTELFNSPSKLTRTTVSTGGIIEFTPGFNFTDGRVYYWRVSPVPVTGSPVWNSASFLYIGNHDYGFNQSHYYQHTRSVPSGMNLTYPDTWNFDTLVNSVYVRNGVWGTAITQETQLSVSINDDPYIRSVCGLNVIAFNIMDAKSFKPWENQVVGGGGLYGSNSPGCGASRKWNFEFTNDSVGRRKARDFLRIVPAGNYVITRGVPLATTNEYVDKWIADAAVYGAGNTLYDELKTNGVTVIDSFTSPRAYSFVFKRYFPNYPVYQIISAGKFDPINLAAYCSSYKSVAELQSPVWGPAKAWKRIKWNGNSEATGDTVRLDVIGVTSTGTESILYSDLNVTQQDFDISAVNATIYPFIKFKLKTVDSLNFTPYQLKYWRVTYMPVPEGALAGNLLLQFKDTIEVGEPLDFKMAFKNISDAPFDSLKVKFAVTDRNNVEHIIPVPRRRPIAVNNTPGMDTVHLAALIPTHNFAGINTLFVEANPANDQPEQYHFNNFAFRNFYAKPDSLNPLLDVTFDGVHILNRDIVASKPDILIKLKDEAKWMLLDDTSLIEVYVKFPNLPMRRYYFNTDTLKFTPAAQAPTNDNTATIQFKPWFPVDGEYQLIVRGRDRSSNAAGMIEYRVNFQVINKPMISNMLNYPNPFTTSTAFVFTITGAEVPQNIKIEIMTITGKIVREITKEELGLLHVGRNITEFKWDGTDQYGQKLANGIYLYRVVTNLNGRALDKYHSENDNTDKYFNKGYGKMVLIR